MGSGRGGLLGSNILYSLLLGSARGNGLGCCILGLGVRFLVGSLLGLEGLLFLLGLLGRFLDFLVRGITFCPGLVGGGLFLCDGFGRSSLQVFFALGLTIDYFLLLVAPLLKFVGKVL